MFASFARLMILESMRPKEKERCSELKKIEANIVNRAISRIQNEFGLLIFKIYRKPFIVERMTWLCGWVWNEGEPRKSLDEVREEATSLWKSFLVLSDFWRHVQLSEEEKSQAVLRMIDIVIEEVANHFSGHEPHYKRQLLSLLGSK